jgi:plastocyanin
MRVMIASFKPGDRVRLEDAPEWGVGQVQSAIGSRVTVNFEQAGKQTVDCRVAKLVMVRS